MIGNIKWQGITEIIHEVERRKKKNEEGVKRGEVMNM
jgi:hypothetical protein